MSGFGFDCHKGMCRTNSLHSEVRMSAMFKLLGRFPVTVALSILSVACAESPTGIPEFNGSNPAIFVAPDRTPFAPDTVSMLMTKAGQFGLRYYGKWCGPDWSGGTAGGELPIDRMDTACRTHDRAYESANNYWGPKYRAATTTTMKNSYCTSWRTAYKNADNSLAASAANLPSRIALAYSVSRGETPDVWGYDKRIYGAHPWSAYQRSDYAYNVRIVNALLLFRDPACSTT